MNCQDLVLALLAEVAVAFFYQFERGRLSSSGRPRAEQRKAQHSAEPMYPINLEFIHDSNMAGRIQPATLDRHRVADMREQGHATSPIQPSRLSQRFLHVSRHRRAASARGNPLR